MRRKPKYQDIVLASNEYSAANQMWQDYTESAGFVDNRTRRNIIIKHAFSVVARNITSLSLMDIGSIINKDHATVLHAQRKHEENLMYLQGYKNVYNSMEYQLKSLLNTHIDINDAYDIEDVKELRMRLIETSSRLRMKIVEYKHLEKYTEESPARAVAENKILTKLLKDVQHRNQNLNKELLRLKNLL